MFSDQNLSKYQRDFRKGFSVQYSLVAMLERWKGAANNKKVFGALLTDLSKELDCFFHELIIAKLNAYGFSFPALKFIHYYLSNRPQRTKINHDFTSWEEVLFGVFQGSSLGTLLFNIFLSDSFLAWRETEFTSCADDNTLHDTGTTIEDVISSLQE